MRGDHSDRIHNRIAGGDGLLFERRRNPDGGHAECRLPRLLAGQRTPARIAGNRQHLRSLRLPAADLDAAQRNKYSRGSQAQIVGDVHRGHQKAHLRGEMAAQRAHPVQQLPALLLIHQRNQLETNLERQIFEAQQARQIREPGACSAFFFSTAPISAGAAAAALQRCRRPTQNSAAATSRNAISGRPGIRHMRRADHAGQIERGGTRKELLANLGAQHVRPNWRGSA